MPERTTYKPSTASPAHRSSVVAGKNRRSARPIKSSTDARGSAENKGTLGKGGRRRPLVRPFESVVAEGPTGDSGNSTSGSASGTSAGSTSPASTSTSMSIVPEVSSISGARDENGTATAPARGFRAADAFGTTVSGSPSPPRSSSVNSTVTFSAAAGGIKSTVARPSSRSPGAWGPDDVSSANERSIEDWDASSAPTSSAEKTLRRAIASSGFSGSERVPPGASASTAAVTVRLACVRGARA